MMSVVNSMAAAARMRRVNMGVSVSVVAASFRPGDVRLRHRETLAAEAGLPLYPQVPR
jgi:hypothetical protein